MLKSKDLRSETVWIGGVLFHVDAEGVVTDATPEAIEFVRGLGCYQVLADAASPRVDGPAVASVPAVVSPTIDEYVAPEPEPQQGGSTDPEPEPEPVPEPVAEKPAESTPRRKPGPKPKGR